MDGDAPHYSFYINDLPVMSKNESILFNLSCSLLRTHYDRTNKYRLWKTSSVQVQDSGHPRKHVFSSKPVLWIYLTLNASRK